MSRVGERPQIDHAVVEMFKPMVLMLLEKYDAMTPELSRGNLTDNPNTLKAVKIMDWFLEHLDCPSRKSALRGAMKFLIIHYDWDAPYRGWIDALLNQFMDSEWVFSDKKPYMWKE